MPFPLYYDQIFKKLRSTLKKLRSEIQKNIPQPETWNLKKLEKVSKKKACDIPAIYRKKIAEPRKQMNRAIIMMVKHQNRYGIWKVL